MDIGEVVIPVPTKTAQDASILVLFASPGDTIEKDQLIALLQGGDKGVLQVASPFSGVVKEVQVKVGARVAPGSPILTLDRMEVPGRGNNSSSAGTRRLPALMVRQVPDRFVFSAPTLAAFQRQIEGVLGGPLTAPATVAVADFWTHWKAFSDGLARKDLAVQSHEDRMPCSPKQRPGRHYQTVQKLARPLALAGLVLVFFLWQAAVALIALGLALHFGAAYLKSHHEKRRHQGSGQTAEFLPYEAGMVKLCAQYILGVVTLASVNGRAQWPDYPSNVLTGKRKLIPGAQSRKHP